MPNNKRDFSLFEYSDSNKSDPTIGFNYNLSF